MYVLQLSSTDSEFYREGEGEGEESVFGEIQQPYKEDGEDEDDNEEDSRSASLRASLKLQHMFS